MGPFPFTVETLDFRHPSTHRLADFAELPVATAAAKLALDDKRVSMAIVRDATGLMVFAVDRRREWTGK